MGESLCSNLENRQREKKELEALWVKLSSQTPRLPLFDCTGGGMGKRLKVAQIPIRSAQCFLSTGGKLQKFGWEDERMHMENADANYATIGEQRPATQRPGVRVRIVEGFAAGY